MAHLALGSEVEKDGNLLYFLLSVSVAKTPSLTQGGGVRGSVSIFHYRNLTTKHNSMK